MLLLGDVMATVLVELEWHGGYPGSGEGHTSYATPIPGATSRSMHHTLDQPFARAAMTRQVTSAIKGRPFGWPVLDVLLIRRAGDPGTCRWVARRETICDSFVVQPLLFANL
jgi:hypothetical protein